MKNISLLTIIVIMVILTAIIFKIDADNIWTWTKTISGLLCLSGVIVAVNDSRTRMFKNIKDGRKYKFVSKTDNPRVKVLDESKWRLDNQNHGYYTWHTNFFKYKSDLDAKKTYKAHKNEKGQIVLEEDH